MDALPINRPRTATGPMGCLNYPPEIMNQIYRELLVDDSQVLCFLCSTDPAFQTIGLKQAVNPRPTSSTGELDWAHLYDTRYYVDSNGLSAQFLRVCKRIWREGSAVLYGNLTIAMRWTPKPDPCLGPFFKRNTHHVLTWAKVVYPRSSDPLPLVGKGSSPWHLLHWGATHPTESWDLDRQTLRRIREKRLSETGRRTLRTGARSASC
ncbi:uncharacterized protein Z520_06128 [Fonsecaea multimorphosa CBS 102226]|uniref:Uncharacterized protein n=1 Tax=Fonsecaea multimorphosa CBS 102226 TaxID=1442371 RepID=A0A0D2K4E9_9EURO|nr:uncharacterized protein Z520_06128 [Fonsecaea multimorphosa CBS 102226]KIX98049.1 hypothetical protein Z520_06128 [Fonsecaea multimorphosa CBS 102226]